MNLFLIFLFCFLLILSSLFLISKELTKDLGRFFFRLTRSQKTVVYILALIYFPGTLIHEMSHLLTASILGVHTGRVELFPEIDGDNIKLGSVQIAQSDVIRRSLIGTAPFIFGIALILIFFFVFPPNSILNSSLLIQSLVIYFLFQVSNTMYSSSKDMEGVTIFLIALTTLIVACFIGGYIFLGDSLISFLTSLDYSFLINYLSKASQLLLIPLGIDIFALTLIKILLRIRV